MEREGYPVKRFSLECHLKEFSADTDELLYQAFADGIILDVEVVDGGSEKTVWCCLAGSFGDLKTYVERLSARLSS